MIACKLDPNKLLAQHSLIRESIELRRLDTRIRHVQRDRSSSKLSRARELYQEHGSDMSRVDLIDMLVTRLGLTKAGATTYYSKLKNNT